MTEESIRIEAGDLAPSKTLFRPVDWAAFWTAFVISLGVYGYTVAPTVTLEDSGELATASAFLGVPHPPGYPVWTIMTWLFTKIFSFVLFRGQPNPAWAVAFASAVFGALASGLTAILICRSGNDMLSGFPRSRRIMGPRLEQIVCWSAGVSGSLIFAFSSVNWSQAVITEVYSLNAFFLLAVLFLAYVWMRRPKENLPYLSALLLGIGLFCLGIMCAKTVWLTESYGDIGTVGIHYVVGMIVLLGLAAAMVWVWRKCPEHRLLYLTAFTFGMGLTNYQVLLLLMASLGLVVLLKDLTLLRDFMIAGLPFLLFFALTQKGFVDGHTAEALASRVKECKDLPATWRLGYVYSALALVMGCGLFIALQTFAAERFRLFKQILLLVIPYACVFFLISKGTLTATSYQGVDSALPAFDHPTHTSAYVYFFLNFLVLALVYFFLPRGRAVAPTILFLELGLAIYVFMPLASETNPPMNWGYPRTWAGFKHALTRGQYEKLKPTPILSAKFVRQVGDYLRDLRITFTLPLAILGFLPFTAWHIKSGKTRVRAIHLATILAGAAIVIVGIEELLSAGEGQIGALSTGYRLLIALILILVAIGGCVMLFGELWDLVLRFWHDNPHSSQKDHSEDPIAMDVDRVSRKWTMVTLSGFLVMSVILISLASPKGDIQDAFIQRVKFISSHALFAIWIGYGIIFGLGSLSSMIDAIAEKRRGFVLPGKLILWGGVIVAALLWLEPIRQNATNQALIRVYGGAEQHGHDYGWQFGNYQLRGADAILEELDPDEEPLPNPEFPPEMTRDAVFYGGTDPGRFVPTYMIYSARVREDVFLITQNALADNTFMSVTRDLYGDQIWIPSQPDSAKAFQRYVEDVQSGKRARNANLRIEGGRVQITGALGVMEINGILAQMIFEHNRYRHDFYVEESYVIRWMYDYLLPHGLIMKINADKVPKLTSTTIRNDRDFWDWYTRRLTDSARFKRDVVARKSFSKLRSAIGGLYASRNMLSDAEAAFKEAYILYPLSPEANFRLVQEVLMRRSRYGEARDIMQVFGEEDPGNTRVPKLIEHLANFEKWSDKITDLSARQKSGKIDIESALELAELYAQMQQKQKFLVTIQNILRSKKLPPQYYFRIAVMLHRMKLYPQMLQALSNCRRQMPPNVEPRLLLDMAKMYAAADAPKEMRDVMGLYTERRPDDWKALLDLASLELKLGRKEEALRALKKALARGGPPARAIMRQDPNFTPLLEILESQARDLMNIGR